MPPPPSTGSGRSEQNRSLMSVWLLGLILSTVMLILVARARTREVMPIPGLPSSRAFSIHHNLFAEKSSETYLHIYHPKTKSRLFHAKHKISCAECLQFVKFPLTT